MTTIMLSERWRMAHECQNGMPILNLWLPEGQRATDWGAITNVCGPRTAPSVPPPDFFFRVCKIRWVGCYASCSGYLSSFVLSRPFFDRKVSRWRMPFFSGSASVQLGCLTNFIARKIDELEVNSYLGNAFLRSRTVWEVWTLSVLKDFPPYLLF